MLVALVVPIIVADGERSDAFPSSILSQVEPNALGNAGKIVIDTSSLSVTNGATIGASTFGKGDTGAIKITASEGITIDGEDSESSPSKILSRVNMNAEGEGQTIIIDTSTLSLSNGGAINTSTFGKGDAGDVKIIASDSVSLSGTVFDEDLNRDIGGVLAFTLTTGEAGDITINTPQLTISEGAGIEAFTQGEGKAGDITINATESLILNTDTKLIVESSDLGTAGNIDITTPLLTIGENAQLSATATETSTSPKAGNITLNVSQLNIAGELGIFAETQSMADAGSLEIQPYQTNPNLNIQFTDEGFISARTTSIGDGGSITITAPETIDIRGQGSITAETSGSGPAGSIKINTQNLTIVDGAIITTSTGSSGKAGDINLTLTDSLFISDEGSGLFANTESNSAGDGGDITVNSPQINLENKAAIAVNSFGEGIGGDIKITADLLNLDQSNITAETRSSDGGNPTLNIQNLLTLSNSSKITATAGTAQAGGDGGNINIAAGFIIAVPDENSDITANAFEGDGGNIGIITQGLFGIEFRETETPLSDITVSSEFGLDGNVQINTLETDPLRGLAILPEEPVDTQIQQGCQGDGTQANVAFFNLGRGGSPSSPEDPFSTNPITEEWTPLDDEPVNDSNPENSELPPGVDKQTKIEEEKETDTSQARETHTQLTDSCQNQQPSGISE